MPASEGTYGHRSVSAGAGPFALSFTRHAPGAVLPMHTHERATITVVLGGEYEEALGREVRQLAPMGAVVKPAGEAHANRIGGGGARSLLVELDAAALSDDPAARALIAEPRMMETAPAADLVIRLVRELHGSGAAMPFALESLMVEWMGLASGDSDETGGRRPPPWLRRLRERLHATPPAELRLTTLAAEAGYHPVYVTRVFRRCYGQSISTYIRRLRVAQAARALASAPRSRSVGRVAIDAGYYDHSHLTNDFRARTGISPTRWRRLVQSSEQV